jgi:hypothetical protein
MMDIGNMIITAVYKKHGKHCAESGEDHIGVKVTAAANSLP